MSYTFADLTNEFLLSIFACTAQATKASTGRYYYIHYSYRSRHGKCLCIESRMFFSTAPPPPLQRGDIRSGRSRINVYSIRSHSAVVHAFSLTGTCYVIQIRCAATGRTCLPHNLVDLERRDGVWRQRYSVFTNRILHIQRARCFPLGHVERAAVLHLWVSVGSRRKRAHFHGNTSI